MRSRGEGEIENERPAPAPAPAGSCAEGTPVSVAMRCLPCTPRGNSGRLVVTVWTEKGQEDGDGSKHGGRNCCWASARQPAVEVWSIRIGVVGLLLWNHARVASASFAACAQSEPGFCGPATAPGPSMGRLGHDDAL